MFNSLKKLFLKHEKSKTSNNKSTMKKFEYQIEVFDKDLTDSGQIQLRPRGQQTVTASSRQELINLYTMCDQQIKILSERPLPSEPNKPNHQDVDLSQLAIHNTAPSAKA